MSIYTLFPTTIASFVLDPPLSKEEKDAILHLKRKNNFSNVSSDSDKILDIPNLSRLKNFFSNSVDRYLEEIINPATDCNLYITQSWANYTDQNQSHHKHHHPNSIISGVFYADVDSERDKIYFYRKDLPQIKIVSRSYTPLNSDFWWLPVENNLLLLFPSYIEHEVKVVEKGKTRVSLSFNTFIKGEIGDESESSQLILGEKIGKVI
jgi:uncharacterized protein (TIGR02466 family)